MEGHRESWRTGELKFFVVFLSCTITFCYFSSESLGQAGIRFEEQSITEVPSALRPH